MEVFKDEFTEKEEKLLQDLKSNCKEDGREIDLEISALIFHKLGSIYLQRSCNCSTIEGILSLIKSATLLQGALVRTSNDQEFIIQDLKKVFQLLLKAADVEKEDVDLLKEAQKVECQVENMRKHVNEELLKILKVEAHKSEIRMSQQESQKIKAIEALQNKITADYIDIMSNLAKNCEEIVGKAPCNFVIVGMGSLARKEITPFSDFEHIIVLDSSFDDQNENALNYFRWYSVIFQIILINLGETIIPSIINETNSNFGSWFYDDVTKSGLSFDGNFPWACKFPLGRQQPTKGKKWKTELIKSVPDMLKYLSSEETLKNGYHLGDILTKICYVYGDKSLYDEFESGVIDIMNKEHKDLKTEVLNQIQDDLENFAIRSVLLKITTEGKFNVKKDIYRATTLFVSALGRLNKISATSCFEVIRQLAKKQVISNNTKLKLMYAIALACEIRLRWYMINEKQKNEICDHNAASIFLDIVGETSTVSYFQIAYALQCDISKKFDLKKGHFYSHPHLLNISIFSIFQNSTELNYFINSFHPFCGEHRLLEFDICFKMLVTKSKKFQHTSACATDRERAKDLSEKFFCKGQVLFEMKKYTDAKELFEKALNIQQQISSDVATDRNVAKALHEIGQCLIETNELADAKSYLEKALEIEQRLASDITTDGDIADTFHTIGNCLIRMNKLAYASSYLEKALRIKVKISTDIATDKSIALTLHAIGACLTDMDKLTDARYYLEKALRIKQLVSTNITIDREVSVTLHKIGQCLMQMNRLADATSYLEDALKIRQLISSNVDTDRDVAVTLNLIGQCRMAMDEYTEAKEYLENSLQIKVKTSSDVSNDREVAISRCTIGQCLMHMDKLSDAKEYLENALKTQKQISRNVSADSDVAVTLHSIGQCLIRMNKLSDAKDYLEKALTIYQQVSCDVASEKNVGITLSTIGECLSQMNKHADAKVYWDKALKIQLQLSNDVATDRRVGVILFSIGHCLMAMGNYGDAKEHLEKSLKIDQQIVNKIDSDKNAFSTLHKIGQCLMHLNKYTDAKDYLEKALKIRQKISGKASTDRCIALISHEIGDCLMAACNYADAETYLKKAIKIYQRIRNDVATDKEMASILRQMSQCCMSMHKHNEAKENLEKSSKIWQKISSDLDNDEKVFITL